MVTWPGDTWRPARLCVGMRPGATSPPRCARVPPIDLIMCIPSCNTTARHNHCISTRHPKKDYAIVNQLPGVDGWAPAVASVRAGLATVAPAPARSLRAASAAAAPACSGGHTPFSAPGEVPPKAAPQKLADMKSCRRERVSVAGIAIRLIETDGTHVACPRGAPSFRCAAAVARARRSLPWNAIQYRPWLLRHICCLTRTVCAPQCQELSSVACCPSRSYRALRQLRAC